METLNDFALTACLYSVGIFTISWELIAEALVTAVSSQQLNCLYPARVSISRGYSFLLELTFIRTNTLKGVCTVLISVGSDFLWILMTLQKLLWWPEMPWNGNLFSSAKPKSLPAALLPSLELFLFAQGSLPVVCYPQKASESRWDSMDGNP